MLGPTFGELLDQVLGWRASFYVLALFGAAVLALCWTDLRETNSAPSNTIAEQYRAYPELLGSKRFWAYCVCLAFSVGAFYAFLAGAPLAASALDLSPAILGLYLGSITGGFMAGSFLAGRLPVTTILVVGRIVSCAGLLVGLMLYAGGIGHVLAFRALSVCWRVERAYAAERHRWSDFGSLDTHGKCRRSGRCDYGRWGLHHGSGRRCRSNGRKRPIWPIARDAGLCSCRPVRSPTRPPTRGHCAQNNTIEGQMPLDT